MALDLDLSRIVEKVDETMKAVLEMRRLFGRQGFLDAYSTAPFERTALTTCEYLLCVLLPMETFSTHTSYRDRFASALSNLLLPLITDDIIEIVRQATGDNFDASEPPGKFGKPYAFKMTSFTKDFSDSVDGAAFFVTTSVLLKKHLRNLLVTPYNGHSLEEWLDKVLALYLAYLKVNKFKWGWHGSRRGQRPQDPQLFFTWTATEALVLAAENGYSTARDLLDGTLPAIEEQISEFVQKPVPSRPEELIRSSYELTHLLIIGCLLGSEHAQVASLIDLSFEYWEHVRPLTKDPSASLENVYNIDGFQVVDVGLLPLYIRGLLLSLPRKDMPRSAVETIEKNIYELYSLLTKLTPKEPPDQLHPSLQDFNLWRLLGAEKENGSPYIFLTERVIEAYCSIAEALLKESPAVATGVSLSLIVDPKSLDALYMLIKRRLEEDGVPSSESGTLVSKIIELEKRLVALEEAKTRKIGGGQAPASQEQLEKVADLTKFVLGLAGPLQQATGGLARAPTQDECDQIKKQVESLQADATKRQQMKVPITELAVANQEAQLRKLIEKYWDRNEIAFLAKKEGIEL